MADLFTSADGKRQLEIRNGDIYLIESGQEKRLYDFELVEVLKDIANSAREIYEWHADENADNKEIFKHAYKKLSVQLNRFDKITGRSK